MGKCSGKMELLRSAPIPKALVALGVPIMVGMLINALYNLVDAYFVGGLGERPIADLLSAAAAVWMALRLHKELLREEKSQAPESGSPSMGLY